MNINDQKLSERQAKNSVVLIILIAILVSIIFFQFGKPFNIDGHVPILNMDTFLYTQYAKAWAEGHPYQFNAADSPTTGCTSHLYPFLLGLFHIIGFHDLSLIDVAFILNIIFFILSAVCYWRIAEKLYPKQKWIAILLFLFSGHLILGIFGLSDAGIFLLFSLLTWYSALYKRYILMAIVFFSLPFVRPEGMLIIFLFGLIVFIERIMNKKPAHLVEIRKKLYVCLFGFLGIITVWIINFSLTGMIVFDSMLGKNILFANQWLTGLAIWIQGTIKLFYALFWGGENTLRLYYMIPMISGLLILIAIFTLPWNKKMFSTPLQIEFWFLLCIILTSIVLMQNTLSLIHNDRYLIWILPLFYFFIIRGINILPLPDKIKKGVLIIFILFQLTCMPIFLRIYVLNCGITKPIILTYQSANEVIKDKVKEIGVCGGSGIVKYIQPDWHIINIGGVTSPFFRDCIVNNTYRIKKIQYLPELQFNYFIKDQTSFYEDLYPFIIDSTVAEIPDPFMSSVKFFQLNWNKLGTYQKPIDKNIHKIIKQYSLIDKLDIGYSLDEKRCHYKINSRYAYTKEKPFLTNIEADSINWTDAAIGVLGYDIFKFKTIPYKPHCLVIRTLPKAEVRIQTLEGDKKLNINTEPVKQLVLKIDDTYDITLDLQEINSQQNLKEWVIMIPANVIKNNNTKFALYGDHIVSDYWLYTKE